ncbi:MAG: hypothetical protein NWQ19_05010 [Nonlabens sp.]|nr:hypothetical protein [Nonlabens sp.]
MNKIITGIAVIFLLQSCSYFKNTGNTDGFVTLEGYSLSKDEIAALLPDNYTPEDSAKIVDAFIDQWALDRLIFERSKDNIAKDDQEKLDELVEKYRIELYSQTYLQDLTLQKLDTALSNNAIIKYYGDNKQQFRLSEDLIKFKYVHLTTTLNNVAQVERLFNSNSKASKRELDSMSVNFKGAFLNDSIWNRKGALLERVSRITPDNENSYIIAGRYSKLEDSVSVYLVRVNDVLKRGEIAPLDFIKPTVREVLLNKNKLRYLKKIQNEILDDAKSSDKLKINR